MTGLTETTETSEERIKVGLFFFFKKTAKDAAVCGVATLDNANSSNCLISFCISWLPNPVRLIQTLISIKQTKKIKNPLNSFKIVKKSFKIVINSPESSKIVPKYLRNCQKSLKIFQNCQKSFDIIKNPSKSQKSSKLSS